VLRLCRRCRFELQDRSHRIRPGWNWDKQNGAAHYKPISNQKARINFEKFAGCQEALLPCVGAQSEKNSQSFPL
jgi:hypothetical protein